MSEPRSRVKMDFVSGISDLRTKPDPETTELAVAAGREVGFLEKPETTRSVYAGIVKLPAVEQASSGKKIDGRTLRSRGADTQLNVKVTAAQKLAIINAANICIQDPYSNIRSVGDFIVRATSHYTDEVLRKPKE
jgi:hypothetical protein